MEAKDLMIGDWFNFIIANKMYQPMKVESIEFGDATSEEDVTTEARELQPIPLTAEILGKNFKKIKLPDEPYGVYFFGSNDYIEVYIKEYSDGLWQVDVDEIEMGGMRSWRMYVRNVHELQHAIRLCEIDKEIEL